MAPNTQTDSEPVTIADEHNPQDGAVYRDPVSGTLYISDGPDFGAHSDDSVDCWTVAENEWYSHYVDNFRKFHKIADTLKEAAKKGEVAF